MSSPSTPRCNSVQVQTYHRSCCDAQQQQTVNRWIVLCKPKGRRRGRRLALVWAKRDVFPCFEVPGHERRCVAAALCLARPGLVVNAKINRMPVDVCHTNASAHCVAAIVTSGIEGVGQPAAFVLGGGVGVESVGYALTLAADGQSATTAPCETFGSPGLGETRQRRCVKWSRGHRPCTGREARAHRAD